MSDCVNVGLTFAAVMKTETTRYEGCMLPYTVHSARIRGKFRRLHSDVGLLLDCLSGGSQHTSENSDLSTFELFCTPVVVASQLECEMFAY
jgi:hypothetical protein